MDLRTSSSDNVPSSALPPIISSPPVSVGIPAVAPKKKFSFVLVLVLAILLGSGVLMGVYKMGLLKLPTPKIGGVLVQQSALGLANAEALAPANTQIFSTMTSSPTLNTHLRDPFLKFLVDALPQDKKDKIQNELGLPFTVDALRKLLPEGFTLALWPKVGTSLAQNLAKPTSQGPLPIGFLADFTFSNTDLLNQVMAKIMASAKEKNLVYTTEVLGTGNLATLTVSEHRKLVWYADSKRLLVGLDRDDITAAMARQKAGNPGIASDLLYQQARAQTEKNPLGFLFINLKTNVNDLLVTVDSPMPPELAQLIRSFDYATSGWSLGDAKALTGRFMLHSDTALGGALAKVIFTAAKPVVYASPSAIPATSNYAYAVNLKTLWQIADDVMATMPEMAKTRAMPAQQLQMMGLDLQKDVLDALTGEVAFSADMKAVMAGYANQLAGGKISVPTHDTLMNSLGSLNLFIGFADKAKVQSLIQRVAGPFLMAAQTKPYKNTAITSIGSMGAFAYINNFLMVGFNEQSLQAVIDAGEAGQTLKQRPSMASLDADLAARNALFLMFTDMQAYLESIQPMLASMSQQPGAPAADAQAQQSLQTLVATQKDLFTDNWTTFSLGNDGIAVTSAMTFAK